MFVKLITYFIQSIFVFAKSKTTYEKKLAHVKLTVAKYIQDVY